MHPGPLVLVVCTTALSCTTRPPSHQAAETAAAPPHSVEIREWPESESRMLAPIEDVDPSIRHPVAIFLPTVMRASRQGSSLVVRFSTVGTHLMVGHKMVTGITCSTTARQGAMEYPMGTSVSSGVDLFASPEFKQGSSNLPSRSTKLLLEYHVEVFETDMPVDHMWMPEGGRHYRILWTHTFLEAVR